MGPGGVLYAGNTGGAEYALNPNGRLRWLHPTGNSVWSNAAIGEDGSVYFGSLDLSIYASTARGRLKWKRGTLGLRHLLAGDRPDGHRLHRLLRRRAARARPADRRRPLGLHDRRPRLRVAGARARAASTSPPPTARSTRSTCAATCAGATTPATPSAPRPCSGRAPRGGGRILYVGSANGSLYALDARDRPPALVVRHHPARPGAARPQRPQLLARAGPPRRLHRRRARADRASCPTTGACTRAATRRCNRSPGEAFGGSLDPDGLRHARAAARGCRARAARCRPPPRSPRAWSSARSARPWTPASTAPTTRDRRPALRLHRPALRRRPLPPHRPRRASCRPDATFTLRVEGGWAGDERSGAVADTIRFRTAPVRPPRTARCAPGRRLPAQPPGRPAAADPAEPQPDRLRLATTWSWARCACRRPTRNGEGSLLLWAVSTKRGPGGVPMADRRGAFAFPLQGRYRDDSLLLSQRGLSLTFSLRRRAAAPLRPAHADGRRPRARAAPA